MAARKKTATGNIDARLAALRADIQALQTDMKGLYGDVSEVASERAETHANGCMAPKKRWRKPTQRC